MQKGERLRRYVSFPLALILPLIILQWPWYQPQSANRCFAILICVVMLWLSHVIPMFVTALLIPLLCILLSVMRDADGAPLDAPHAAPIIVSSMFNSTVLVLLASFTISLCFSSSRVAFFADNPVMRRLSGRVWLLLMVVMAATLAACMFIPNISAAILVYTFVSGKLQRQEVQASVSKALLIGIAMAGNIGGLMSPISSPQSVYAFGLASENFQVTWFTWLKTSLPVGFVSLTIAWAMIVVAYGLHKLPPLEDSIEEPILEPDRAESSPGRLWTILAITFLTIGLWASTSVLSMYVGDMGIVSLVPLILFFGLGVLSEKDLGRIPWDIVLLAMGALALTEASKSSGLLAAISKHLFSSLDEMPYYPQLLLACLFIFLTATFKSHIVAALLFLPIIMGYIEKAGMVTETRGMVMFMCTSFVISSAMALPFSGLVNLGMMAVSDGEGNRILSFVDFLKIGIPASVTTYMVIVTLGAAILQA